MRSLLLLACAGVVVAQSPQYGVGRPATADEIRQWSVTVRPDGKGLPEGSGTVAAGKEIFESRCVKCHGSHGEGRDAVPLTGGAGTLATASPLKTVASY